MSGRGSPSPCWSLRKSPSRTAPPSRESRSSSLLIQGSARPSDAPVTGQQDPQTPGTPAPAACSPSWGPMPSPPLGCEPRPSCLCILPRLPSFLGTLPPRGPRRRTETGPARRREGARLRMDCKRRPRRRPPGPFGPYTARSRVAIAGAAGRRRRLPQRLPRLPWRTGAHYSGRGRQRGSRARERRVGQKSGLQLGSAPFGGPRWPELPAPGHRLCALRPCPRPRAGDNVAAPQDEVPERAVPRQLHPPAPCSPPRSPAPGPYLPRRPRRTPGAALGSSAEQPQPPGARCIPRLRSRDHAQPRASINQPRSGEPRGEPRTPAPARPHS